MAYSLGDPYRSLRTILRINGVLLGGALGLLLLVAGPRLLAAFGFGGGGPLFPYRLAGAALIAVGAFLLAAASRPDIDRGQLIATLLFHTLLAVALLAGYLGGDIRTGNIVALLLLLGAFLLCLLGALAPLRYFGPEYRL
jgi:hypothetical protein